MKNKKEKRDDGKRKTPSLLSLLPAIDNFNKITRRNTVTKHNYEIYIDYFKLFAVV